MSFKVYTFGTVFFGITTIICSIYTIICLKKESSSKSSIISIIISIGSLIVTLFASFNVNIPSPIILPLDNEVQVYGGSTKISIESDEKGCEIYYTLNGKDPKNSGKKYNGTFSISDSTTICARNKYMFWWSDISKSTYRFEHIEITYNSNVDSLLSDKLISVDALVKGAIYFVISIMIFKIVIIDYIKKILNL